MVEELKVEVALLQAKLRTCSLLECEKRCWNAIKAQIRAVCINVTFGCGSLLFKGHNSMSRGVC